MLLVVALLVMVLAWVMVLRPRSGLVIRRLERDDVPMLFMVPAEAQNVPAVLIAHGFGGSKQLMLGYGYVLARAGYAVLLWDFAGHAANAAALDMGRDALQQNLDSAYAELIAQPEVDDSQVALLGHSMGSGAVMTAGIRDVDRYRATVAVSPTSAEVTETAPRNLLLQAGALEPQFAENAEGLLAAAGGANDDLVNGRGRAFALIPAVEHITILFSSESHQAALNWLDHTFGRSNNSDYRDGRILWYAAHVVAGAVMLAAAGPLFPRVVDKRAVRPRWAWVALLTAPFLATGLLALVGQVSDITRLGGLLVGGALGLWLLFMGLVLCLGYRPNRPTRRGLLWGALLFTLLWLIFGALAQVVWLPWLLVPARLVRWPLLVLLCLPWTVAAAHGSQSPGWKTHVGWWLVQSVLISAGLLLAIVLIPGLFVLVLVLPLFPLIIGLMTIANAALHDPWAGGLGNALFFAWLLLAYFPLAG
jgi:dienelactone hydrolase